MDKRYKPTRVRQEPIILIVWVIAIFAILGGLYLFSPFLIIEAPTGPQDFYEAVVSVAGLGALSVGAIVSGLWMIYGIRKDRPDHIRRGLFLNLTLRIYAALASLVIYGLQTNWLGMTTMIVIEIVIYVSLRNR